MKHSIFNILLILAVLLTSTAQADPVVDLVSKLVNSRNTTSRNDLVMVIFNAKGNVHSALANMKSAMHTRDPGGFLNPYWIVNFPDEAVSTSTNCGVIIGEWYAGNFPVRGSWEAIMNQAISENVEVGAYLYTQNGGFRETSTTQYQLEAINKICFGSAMFFHN